MNQYVNNAIVTMNAASVTADAIKEIVKEFKEQELLTQKKQYECDNVVKFK